MLADGYFQKKHPKSTGPEYFNLDWLSQHLTGAETPEDVNLQIHLNHWLALLCYQDFDKLSAQIKTNCVH
jgi:1,6-anhydro-N-acetylmuramate kinase